MSRMTGESRLYMNAYENKVFVLLLFYSDFIYEYFSNGIFLSFVHMSSLFNIATTNDERQRLNSVQMQFSEPFDRYLFLLLFLSLHWCSECTPEMSIPVTHPL